MAYSVSMFVTPNFNIAATAAFIDPLRAANYLLGESRFAWEFVSLHGGGVMASNSMQVDTRPLRDGAGQPDLFVVSSSWNPDLAIGPELQTKIRNLARSGVRIGAIDTGVFVVAATGLLNGRRATCHYEHIDALIELHPEILVSEDIFVWDEAFVTCCGGSAATDCALHLVRQRLGDRLANEAAHYLFHQSIRPPATRQSPSAPEPVGGTVPDPVRQAIRIMERHLEEARSIPEICAEAGISPRQLNRLFDLYVGCGPAAYYRDIRLDRARGLVTQTTMPILEIAMASGFLNQSHFTRAYRHKFGLTPRDDRLEGRIPFEFRAWPMFQASKPVGPGE
jgi:transcriptional regulator GlxA family with amidase domain